MDTVVYPDYNGYPTITEIGTAHHHQNKLSKPPFVDRFSGFLPMA